MYNSYCFLICRALNLRTNTLRIINSEAGYAFIYFNIKLTNTLMKVVTCCVRKIFLSCLYVMATIEVNVVTRLRIMRGNQRFLMVLTWVAKDISSLVEFHFTFTQKSFNSLQFARFQIQRPQSVFAWLSRQWWWSLEMCGATYDITCNILFYIW